MSTIRSALEWCYVDKIVVFIDATANVGKFIGTELERCYNDQNHSCAIGLITNVYARRSYILDSFMVFCSITIWWIKKYWAY